MGSEDWYRNTDWGPDIAARFEEKLRRARRKEQYLRIQASILADRHPEIALNLLDRYFRMPTHFDHAQGHADRARAFLALGRLEDALVSYEAALRREDEYPNLLTQAAIDLPFLIATRQVAGRFDQAMDLLKRSKARLMFPIDRFKWHVANAMILRSCGDLAAAKVHASEALAEASRHESGFRYHSKLGLVGGEYASFKELMEKYSSA
jgi:tetratricopeptide (TPR) repeat protein